MFPVEASVLHQRPGTMAIVDSTGKRPHLGCLRIQLGSGNPSTLYILMSLGNCTGRLGNLGQMLLGGKALS